MPEHQPGPIVVEGHAIVSADGMIAAADGTMPDGLRNDADWRAFQTALDRAAIVVLGRVGHLRHPNPGRKRLVLTRSVDGLTPDPADTLAMLWNPDRRPFSAALSRLAIRSGVVAVTGGTGTFDLFAPHYDRFVLAEVHDLVIGGGRQCFSSGHPRAVLAGLGLIPGPMEMIDAGAGVTSTLWQRP